eukprot:5555353-Amphidinium_carterae.1
MHTYTLATFSGIGILLLLQITAGALTGAGGSLIANPLDLVKVRMQVCRHAQSTARSEPQ